MFFKIVEVVSILFKKNTWKIIRKTFLIIKKYMPCTQKCIYQTLLHNTNSNLNTVILSENGYFFLSI